MKDTSLETPAFGIRRRQLMSAPLATAMAPMTVWAQAAPRHMVIPRTAQFVSLDPVRGFEETSLDLIEMTYSRLVRQAWLERPYRVEPDLLAALPEVSADGTVYTFTLRKGIRFHDNACFPGGKRRELTSDDVLFSLKRFGDHHLNQTSWFLLEGMVVGLDEFRAATQAAGTARDIDKLSISGFQRLDSHRFTLRLTRPSAQFVPRLATGPLSIVPAEAVRHYGERLGVNPVGTGAFILKEMDRKGVIRWVRNPNYHGTYPTRGESDDAAQGLLQAAGRRLPFLDSVDMPLMEESQPRMLKMLRGELDWIALDRANADKMVRREGDRLTLAPEFQGKFSLSSSVSLGGRFVWINMKDPVLGKNKLLRQALARLFDVAGDVRQLMGGRGRHLASVVPYDLPGSERDTGATPFPHDLAGAKRLLAQAGFPDGKDLPELTVRCGFSGVDWRNRFDFYQSRLAEAGVRIKPLFTDMPTFVKAVEGSNFQLAMYGWIADYPDAENFYQLLYGKNVAPGPNLSSFSNDAYDKAYEASRWLAPGPQRLAFQRQMNAIVSEEVPLIPLHSPFGVVLKHPWVRHFKRHALIVGVEYMDVDPVLRRKGV